jgi:hypothetical protein
MSCAPLIAPRRDSRGSARKTVDEGQLSQFRGLKKWLFGSEDIWSSKRSAFDNSPAHARKSAMIGCGTKLLLRWHRQVFDFQRAINMKEIGINSRISAYVQNADCNRHEFNKKYTVL